ncbi:MAG: primosomal protein N' [Geminicoccaceae bacterium]|nr:primosomal protein N' [Geminicoccaceae bacterium]
MSPKATPVLVPLPLEGPFDYLLPEGEAPPRPGSYVRVPFGKREVVGVVWDEAAAAKVDARRLKPLGEVLDLPSMPAALRLAMSRLAAETVAPKGAVLRLALSVPQAFDPAPARRVYGLPEGPKGEVAPLDARRQGVLKLLAGTGPLPPAELARAAGVSTAILKGMAEKGQIKVVEVDEAEEAACRPGRVAPLDLTAEQAGAARYLAGEAEKGGDSLLLLEGLPGAGKTEVYLEAVDAALAAGRNVLVLLPEIALSAQWLERFERRFGTPPALWHSGLTSVQRRRTWKAVATGKARVVVGARSALFLPMPDLGLIVIDEEHDPSFKQEDGVIYDARIAARLRAEAEGVPLLLVSATPSLETLALLDGTAAEGRRTVAHLRLKGRFGTAPLPRIELVDLKRERPPGASFLSPTLRDALRATLDAGEQSMLFLNRRGYAPLTLCRACGFRFRCPNCSAWLVSHRFGQKLQCHHCGYVRPAPPHCPQCGTVDSLVASGPGVERVAEEIASLLPGARTAVMTSDTVGTATQANRLVHAVLEGRVDVLIGTQLMAKGHHFPKLTLVGVVDGDLGLAGGDPRAAERTFQLLYQLAGRAGREAVTGRVLLQTHLPDHPVMQALARGDRERFLAAERAEREDGGMPPFGRLAALILQGADAPLVRRMGRELARAAPRDDDALVLGPAPAPLSLLRGRYRERLLVKATLDLDLPGYLRRWLAAVRLPGSVHLAVDVDPQSFL